LKRGWLISLIAHAVLLAGLSLFTLASLPSTQLSLICPASAEEEFESFADFEIDLAEQMQDLTEETTSELIDPGESLAGEAATASMLDSQLTGEAISSGAAEGADALGELGALFGKNGAGLGTRGEGLGGAPLARFFGKQIEGRRICFVLDNSGSMQGGRLETVIEELNQSVASLRPDQQFYVIFYSDDVYPLFYPQPAQRFVIPTPEVKEQLRLWLDSVELCYGDVVDEALAAAISIRPDVVYFLSDGKIYSDRDLQQLLASGKPFPIHTFGVGLGNGTVSREKLQLVADANGGEFSEAEITPFNRDLARVQPRAYHREGPGPIWGRRVRGARR
jgi:hypothetical protein